MRELERVSEERFEGWVNIKIQCWESSAPREAYTSKLAMNYETISDTYQPTITHFLIQNVEKHLIRIVAPSDAILNNLKLQVQRAIRKYSAIKSSNSIIKPGISIFHILKDSLIHFPFIHSCFTRITSLLINQTYITEGDSLFHRIQNALYSLIDLAYTL